MPLSGRTFHSTRQAPLARSELAEFAEHRALGEALARWLDTQTADVTAGTSALLMVVAAALAQEARSKTDLDQTLRAAVRFLAASARHQFISSRVGA